MTSKNINNLIKHILITKQEDISIPTVNQQQTADNTISDSFSGVPSKTEQKEQEREQLRMQFPLQFRMYLIDKQYLPRKEPPTSPSELEPPIYPIKSTDGGFFIDKRQLHKFHPELFEDTHAKTEDGEMSFGGIVMNEQGMVLLRKPKPDEDGNPFNNQEWSFAKGGANEGEEGKDAALREVFEETGLKPKLGDEIAGHYQSGFGNNKYFIMHVDENTEKKDFGDETSELKWVTPDEAFELLRQNTDIKDIDEDSLFKDDNRDLTSSERDMNALAMATHQHEKNTIKKRKQEAFGKIGSTSRQSFKDKVNRVKEQMGNIAKDYAEHRTFPKNWDSQPEYIEFARLLVKNIQMSINPDKNDFFDAEIKNLLGILFEEIDKKNGVKFISSLDNQDVSYTDDSISKGINRYISGTRHAKDSFVPSLSGLHWAFTRGMSERHAGLPPDDDSGWMNAGGEPFAGSSVNNGLAQILMPNLMADVVADFQGRPNNYMYGYFLSEEINTRGDLTHRTDSQRQELIEAYEKYDDNLTDGKGTFSWGESYNFADGNTLSNKYLDGDGNVQTRDVDSWDFVYHRAAANQRVRDKIKLGVDPTSRPDTNIADYGEIREKEYHPRLKHLKHQNAFLGQLGESYRKSGDTETRQQALEEYLSSKHGDGKAHFDSLDESEQNIAFGRAMMRDYYQNLRNINGDIWDVAFPNDSYIGVWRKFSGAREVVGDYGLDGASIQAYTGKRRMGADETEDDKGMIQNFLGWDEGLSEDGEGFSVHAHSSTITGGAISPIQLKDNGAGWGQDKYAMLSKVNKNDLMMFAALFKGVDIHDKERETIFLNNATEVSKLYLHADITSDTPDRYYKKGSSNWVDNLFPMGQYPTASESTREAVKNKALKGYTTDWENHTNKVARKNALGDIQQGITESKTDFSEVLVPMTNKDNTLINSENGGKLGSNKGGGMKDKEGNHFYVKTEDENRNIAEVISNNIYKLAGINVPETDLINYSGGKATRSKWLPDTITEPSSSTTPEKFLNNPDIKKGIFIDMILANHDVTGTMHDNLVESDGKMYRLDQGGTLQYRAKSPAPKIGWYDWAGDYIYELGTMMDDEQQEKIYGDQTSEKHRKAIGNASNLYKQMTDADYKSAADTVLNLTNSKLDSIVDESALESPEQKRELKDTLKRRRDSVLKWIVDNKPDAVDQTSLKSLQSKYNILKTELLKSVKEEKDFLHIYINPKEIEYTRGRNHGKIRHHKKMDELYKEGIEESAEGMRKNLFEKGDKK